MVEVNTDDARLDLLLAPFRQFGAASYGEDITQYAHALQCAFLASEAGGAPELVAAALLHDVGQFIGHAGAAAEQDQVDGQHEVTGADLLTGYFAPAVTEPVRLHVAAKRYLCATEPGYRDGLSEASELSLTLQGGPMGPAERAAFEADPHFAAALQLRRFDDAGKRPGWSVPPIDSYRPLLAGLLRPAAASHLTGEVAPRPQTKP